MKIYFIKAEYTDGIYKLNDFFVGNVYKQDNNKMQDIDIKPNDGITTTVVNTKLPDGTNVNDYSHVIVPEANKIYEIDRCLWLNNTQTQISLIEDAFIGHYQQVKSKQIRLERTNDESLFKGIHDIEDITIRPTITSTGAGTTYTGQWVVYFLDPTSVYEAGDRGAWLKIYSKDIIEYDIGKERSNSAVDLGYYDVASTISAVRSKYPEMITANPLRYDYFNKKVRGNHFDINRGQRIFQSVHYKGQIKWAETLDRWSPYKRTSLVDGDAVIEPVSDMYVERKTLTETVGLASDLSSIVLAFPLEKGIGLYPDRGGLGYHDILIPYTPDIGQGIVDSGAVIRDVKIMNESQIFGPEGMNIEYATQWKTPQDDVTHYNKRISRTPFGRTYTAVEAYAGKTAGQNLIYDNDTKAKSGAYILMINMFNPVLDVPSPVANGIFEYEPFKTYSISVFGKEYKVAKKNLDTLKIRFAVAMDQVEYFGYINNDLTQKLFSDSYSTSIKWSMDQLDLFNQQNPTYKDQFNANMWRKGLNSFVGAGKGAALGAISKGGPAGSLIGGGVGLATSAMNIGFDIHVEKLRQKGLELAPDQVFGDGSNISLSAQSKYGILINTYTSDFTDIMKTKYELTGFPTTHIRTINGLNSATTDLFGTSKVIMGQLLETVKNKYITNAINRKLQEGVIIV